MKDFLNILIICLETQESETFLALQNTLKKTLVPFFVVSVVTFLLFQNYIGC